MAFAIAPHMEDLVYPGTGRLTVKEPDDRDCIKDKGHHLSCRRSC